MNLVDRQFVILTRNSLDGFQQGHFQDLWGLYLEKVVEDGGECGNLVEWCDHPFDAKKFHTEVEAWDFARELWGEHFTQRNKMVVSYFPSYDEESVCAAIRQRREEKRQEAIQNLMRPRVIK